MRGSHSLLSNLLGNAVTHGTPDWPNRKKAERRLARLHARIANIRRDGLRCVRGKSPSFIFICALLGVLVNRGR